MLRIIRQSAMAMVLAAFVVIAGQVPVRAETVSVTLLLVNDIYKMEGSGDRGGFARLATVVRDERAKGGHLIYAHAGDTISPSLMSGFDQGEHIIALLNAEAPDIFVPGNHEFDFGPDVFRERLAQSEFPWFAANLRDVGGAQIDGLEDARMFNFDGVMVGVVGITADDSPVKSSPGDLQFSSSIDTAAEKADELGEAGADLVIAVVHANRGQDRELFQSGLYDVILTGDDHDLALFFDGRTVMVESKEEGEFVTAVDLTIDVSDDDGRRRVRWWPNFRLIDTATVDPAPDVAKLVDDYQAELSGELDVEIGVTETELDSRKASVRSGETAIGNLIADAMKEAVGADFAITNGGGIRGNKVYEPGTRLTRRDILTELPFGNKTMLLEVTGAQVLEALENGVSEVENAAGRFPHVSGLVVKADLSAPAGKRITSVMVGEATIDPAATYKLATNDYMGGGGDGYTALQSARPLLSQTDAKLMANDVMVYVRDKQTVSPATEGRIVLE